MALFKNTRAPRPPGPFARFFFGRVFPLIFLCSGGAVAFFGIREINGGRASEGWPGTPAVIVRSSVESRPGNKGGTTYTARVAYRYSVNGTEYVATKLSFGEYGSSDRSHAKEIVDRYPAGATVTVRYPAEDPARAVLEPGVTKTAIVTVCFGAVFFAVGVIMAISLPRALRKQAERAAEIEAAGGSVPMTLEIPKAYRLADSHPKITVDRGLEATVFTTSGRNLAGWIVCFVALAQGAIVSQAFFGRKNDLLFVGGFLAIDAVMLVTGAYILMSRYTVRVAAREVGYRWGLGGLGLKKTIAIESPMTVALEYRGTKINGRDIATVVVKNASGAEFAFGTPLDDERKQFLAGHLTKLLKAEKSAAKNPFGN